VPGTGGQYFLQSGFPILSLLATQYLYKSGKSLYIIIWSNPDFSINTFKATVCEYQIFVSMMGIEIGKCILPVKQYLELFHLLSLKYLTNIQTYQY
jgi:hypothetical protein